MEDDVRQALDALGARLAVLEDDLGDGAEPQKWWLLDALGRRPELARVDGATGRVAYGGQVSAPGTGDVVWQLEHTVPDVLAADLGPVSGVLGALGHPLRLELLRRLLLGASTAAELAEIPGLGTSGQLQHHLRELRAAGLVTQPGRGRYLVPADRVVPLLTIIGAAAGRSLATAEAPSPALA